MVTILDEIVVYKRQFVAKVQEKKSLDWVCRVAERTPKPPSFIESLVKNDDIAVIAEIKKASPSVGIFRTDFDPISIAEVYASNGASAISVLTDEKFFQGSVEDLKQVSNKVELPLVRKDFVIDAYQIYETKLLGASAVLLIVSVLSPTELKKMLRLCFEVGLDAIVEVHTEEEISVAIQAGAEIIGINNRNLQTFQTDLDTTQRLINSIPDTVVVISESGIRTREDVVRLRNVGADAVLVGEVLMYQPDPGCQLRELLGNSRF